MTSDGSIRDYRDLVVWQKAMELVVECYRATGAFPKNETYGLASQLQRAAVSVPANIAEGRGRQHTGEFLQFVGMAYGSLCEVETHVELARRLGHVSDVEAEALLRTAHHVRRLLHGLQQALARKLSPIPHPPSPADP